MVDKEEKDEKNEAEEVKEILSAVSTQVPGLIKSILASVFSEEAGRSMGKAAAAYYKELKNGGMPEQVAVKMTEDYMKTFTSLGEMMKGIGGGGHREGHRADIGEEISRAFDKRKHEKEEQEEE
jgi:DNA gyrase/topoisomerase IV subunit B